jgi:hypothetical protein
MSMDDATHQRVVRAMSRIPALSKRGTDKRRRQRPKSHRIMREHAKMSARIDHGAGAHRAGCDTSDTRSAIIVAAREALWRELQTGKRL